MLQGDSTLVLGHTVYDSFNLFDVKAVVVLCASPDCLVFALRSSRFIGIPDYGLAINFFSGLTALRCDTDDSGF